LSVGRGDKVWGEVLITNDDGMGAAGLEALVEAAQSLMPGRLTVVAPAEEQSQCGHRVTTREPLVVEQVGENRYTVRGTPADCVRVARFGLGLRPDLVLSGINHGGNMGQDLVISGTVAAAREAAYHGIKAVAFSHYLIRDVALDWARAGKWAAAVLAELDWAALGDNAYLNVNLPHHPPGERDLPERVWVAPARSPLGVNFARLEPQGAPAVTEFFYTASYSERPQDVGSDVEACFGGRIALSRVGLLG
jgi:5'-nucleotidase